MICLTTEQLAQKAFSERAKAILKRLLSGQRPGIQDLARELHVSIRMLQRRLTEQGITFQRLLEDARRELARHYLLQSSVELSETAYLLGYEDANSFGPSTIGKGSLPDNGGYSKRTHSRQHNLKSAQGEARKHSETVSMGAAFE